MDKLAIDALGWAGTISDLAAYYLVSTRRMKGDALPYQLLNLFGGLLLTINSVYYHSLPAIATNVIWIAISVFTLRQIAAAGRESSR
ncbi:MAG TPA: hypothetical protein VHM28_11740 [Anaerolineales bacterium]|jgi:hypothetical protein|nr:hypothetical protein [Anaerolineales bacterium]